jgi:hypothetical protein
LSLNDQDVEIASLTPLVSKLLEDFHPESLKDVIDVIPEIKGIK